MGADSQGESKDERRAGGSQLRLRRHGGKPHGGHQGAQIYEQEVLKARRDGP